MPQAKFNTENTLQIIFVFGSADSLTHVVTDGICTGLQVFPFTHSCLNNTLPCFFVVDKRRRALKYCQKRLKEQVKMYN